ncbi:MAG: KH domain-containing protein [Pyrinomonadaceae bacterium]
MREAIEKLVKSIVDDAEAVEVIERGDRSATVLQIRVAGGDMGKVIGREGRTIKALRSLLHAASLKQGRRIALEIVE